MNPRRVHHRHRHRQRGVALVIVLVLLGALMLLSLTGAQSASLEMTMTGNEQYGVRSMAAAERAVAAAEAALAAIAPDGLPAPVTNATDPETPGDHYDYVLRDVGPDARLTQVSGGTRRGRHYTIAATGRSLRGAQVRIECGVRLVRNAGGTLLAVEREFWMRRDVE